MVIAPARTGRDSNRRIAVSKTDHTNSGVLSIVMFLVRILIIVVIKLADPRIEEAPARCKEKMAKSTEAPAWAMFAARGG